MEIYNLSITFYKQLIQTNILHSPRETSIRNYILIFKGIYVKISVKHDNHDNAR